jgi:FixJ family two-component response regulator
VSVGLSVVTIVDDDESMRRAARRLIKSFGLAVETFASADGFLTSGRIEATACLVLGVHIPGLSGPDQQSRLVESEYHIPIIFITAFAGETAEAQALGGIRQALQRQNLTLRGLPPP